MDYGFIPNVGIESIAGKIINEELNPNLKPLYRFWYLGKADHFYTANEVEKDSVLAGGVYKYEGIAGYVYNTRVLGTLPLYRFYNAGGVNHVYVIKESEKDQLTSLASYKYEGIAGYIYPNEVENSVPLYRFYNARGVDHFYTINEDEKKNLIQSYDETLKKGWKYIDILGYLPTPITEVENKTQPVNETNTTTPSNLTITPIVNETNITTPSNLTITPIVNETNITNSS